MESFLTRILLEPSQWPYSYQGVITIKLKEIISFFKYIMALDR